MINGIKTFARENKSEIFYFTVLLIALLVIAIPKWQLQHSINISNWDSYIYLDNGRSFAGMGWGDLPQIAPFVSFMLSIMFRLNGNTYAGAIIDLDIFMYILGSIFFYFLLKLKFDNNVSLVGAIIYSTFTLLYSIAGIGGTDVPGLSFTVITMYLMVVSHRYDNRLYYIAFPVAAFSFLSRYTAGIMIFSIIFYLLASYILTKNIDYKEIKTILKSLLLGFILVSPFLLYFLVYTGNPIPFFGQFAGTVSNVKVLDSGYMPDPWYYLTYLPNYLSSVMGGSTTAADLLTPSKNTPTVLSWFLLALMFIGLLGIAYNIYKGVKSSGKNSPSLDPKKSTTLDLISEEYVAPHIEKNENSNLKYLNAFLSRIDFELRNILGMDELKLKGLLKKLGLNRTRRFVEWIDLNLKKLLQAVNVLNHRAGLIFESRRNLKLGILIAILLAVCIITTNKVSYIVTIALWMIILLVVTELLKDYKIPHLDYDLLMISLFIVYVVFHSILSTKNDRYFITVLPFIAFFITNAIYYFYSFIRSRSRGFDFTKVFSAILILLFVSSALGFCANMPEENRFIEIRDACMWLQEYHPSYNSTTITYSDSWPVVTWYLNVPSQRLVLTDGGDEQIFNYSAKMLFRNETELPASFFIDTHHDVKHDFPGFTKIKTFDRVTIYENNYLLEHDGNESLLNTTSYEFYANKTINYYNWTLQNYGHL